MRLASIFLSMLAAIGLVVSFNGGDISAAEQRLEQVRQRFQGHYELVSFVRFPEEGGEVDMNYDGRIMYDAHGNMSAQGMPRDLPERAAASDSRVRGGFAYWGSVSFDPDNNIVIHHVEGSPTRGSWVGEDNVRHFEFTEEYLKLSMRDESGRTTGTLTWKKYEE